MPIVFLGTDVQWDEINKTNTENECIRVHTWDEFSNTKASLYLFLLPNVQAVDFTKFTAPVIINAVSHTLLELGTPSQVLRINGWHSFVQRSVWEIAGQVSNVVKSLLSSLQKKVIEVPDEVGFVSANVVSMIINEAYFTLQENVSTKNEIDIAMKLGTNYPFGPFEWASIIGTQNIYTLLHKLCITQKRYTPAALLQQEVQQ